jgi:hypothetical protein
MGVSLLSGEYLAHWRQDLSLVAVRTSSSFIGMNGDDR